MKAMEALLQSLHREGARLWVENGELHYRSTSGKLAPERLAEVRRHKTEMIEFLERAASGARKLPPLVAQERSSAMPLSFAQERLWLIEQLGLVGSAYTIPAAFWLRGELDRGALQRAFKDLVARHESLRTRFISVQGQPQQVIDAAGKFECEELDLSGLDSQAQEREVQRLIQEDVQRPFDLAQGPLFRVSLLRLGEQEHVLRMTMHHIVSDGWSTGVLMRDVSALYATHVKSAPGPEPLAIQYADFAVWQRQWLQGAMLQEQLQYWKDRLSGAPAALELPTDHVRPAVASYKGGILPFELESGLYAGLRELARQEGVTLYMVLLAGFQVLLSRWSGQQDIVVGSPIAGRTQRELENLIGFFVNQLLLRSRLQAGQSFRELLAQVKEAALGAYAHQDLPFEKLVAELQPQRDLSRQPLFQVGFAMQNVPQQDLEMAGLKLQYMTGKHVTSKLDLTLFAVESGAQLQCYFEYATDLFECSTIERMVGHFKTLLASAVADPTTAVSRLPLLGAQERRQLLEEWNATAAFYPQERCLHEWISEQAARTPHAVALVCESQQLRYAQLEERSNQLGHYLRGLGVGPEVIVGLCVERSVEMVVGLLGILKAGGAYLPLDPGYPAERLVYMLSDAQAPLLLTQEKQQGVFGDYAGRIVRIDTDWSQIAAEPATAVRSTSTADNLAYVIYTSGSTGKPKGVMVEHRSIANYMHWAARFYCVADGCGAPVNTSLAFDATVTSLLVPLSQGKPIVLLPTGDAEIEALADLLSSGRSYSLAKITPSHLEILQQSRVANERPCALRAMVIGGEALTAGHIAYWRDRVPDLRIINEYGPTEATVGCCIYEVTTETPRDGAVPIGCPIDNTLLYVLDDQMQPVPLGVAGELYIAGAGVARAYLNRPALTAQRFIPDPFSVAARMYRTGDRVRRLKSGDLIFLGRSDTQVKLRGYRIELGEIESTLRDHPAVAGAVVLLREDRHDDPRLVGYVVQQQPGTPPEQHAGVAADMVNHWRELFDSTYVTQGGTAGPSFVGWTSSYTGVAIPDAEMQDWLDQTICSIEQLRPRRILEIGCGVGLLLQRLVPKCEEYVGADLSQSALAQAEQWCKAANVSDRVQLIHSDAGGIAQKCQRRFDTIILNSVVQYFPDVHYLEHVLRTALELLEPNGCIFIGDVRHLGLLRAFHASVQVAKAASDMPLGQLRQQVERGVAYEKELVIDPAFFCNLSQTLPQLGAAEVSLKRSRFDNELSRYRYDVVLRARAEQVAAVCETVDWGERAMSLDSLEAWLGKAAAASIAVLNVPNGRVARDLQLLEEIDRDSDIPAGGPRSDPLRSDEEGSPAKTASFDPELFWRLGATLGFEAHIGCSANRACFDVEFVRLGSATPRQQWRQSALRQLTSDVGSANQPTLALARYQLIPELRKLLNARLPAHMVPATLIVMEEFPLTPNGKIDVKALAPPEGRPDSESSFAAPTTELEQELATIWRELLGLDRIGIHDDFFALGGHSLLATRLVAQVREQLGVELAIRSIFAAPTIAKLVQVMIDAMIELDELDDSGSEAATPVDRATVTM